MTPADPAWTRTAFPALAGFIVTGILNYFSPLNAWLGDLGAFGVTRTTVVLALAALIGIGYHDLAVKLGQRWPRIENWMLGSSLIPTYARRRHGFGYIKDVPDKRDKKYSGTAPAGGLPVSVSLRSLMPKIYNQLQLGACTGNAWAAALDFARFKQGLKFIYPSRLFIYYFERVLEGTVGTDSGAQIRDGAKVVNKYGAPAESLWKYVVSRFTLKPSAAAIAQALTNETIKYSRVAQTAEAIQTALANKLPVVIGFTCYPELESAAVAKSGILPMPKAGEQSIGGHAVVVIGYSTINGAPYWEIRNSWGASWGDKGHFWMPQEYLLDSKLASDFWVIESVEQSVSVPAAA